VATNKVLWKYRPHTEAKHTVLRRFQEARLAIMGQVNGFRELVIVDGFAGPGRYVDGEKGSPLLMLDAFLEHEARDKITARLRYIFIEKHPGRFAYLESEIAAYLPMLPENITVELYNDPFDTRMDAILKDLGDHPPPVFTFVDPFGISDNHREVTSRVLGHRGCEVLVYVPLFHIARHIDAPEFEPHLDKLFSGGPWRNARRVAGLQDRIAHLKTVFETELRKTCKAVLDMAIPGETSNDGYFLFFGTNHPLGVDRMKDVFWKIDPVNGRRYTPTRKSMEDQLLPLVFAPEVAELRIKLAERFRSGEFSIEEAEDCARFDTRFRVEHLRKPVLIPLEASGGLVARHPSGTRRRNSYPPGTVIRLTPTPTTGASPEASASRAQAMANAGV
jgi:three-Cys-motif partner protein